MKISEHIFDRVSEIRNIINEILNEVQNDSLQYDSFQILRQEKYLKYHNSIRGIELGKLIIEAKNLNFNKEIFYGILINIENYKQSYLKKKSKIDAFNLNKLYAVYLKNRFDKEISIAKNDILEVSDIKNALPEIEKEKILREFKEFLANLQNKRDNHIKTFDWFFINYYEKFYEELQAIENLINEYFPEKALESDTDIFERNFANDLYRICVDNQIFKKENVSFENFYLILNTREPKQICVNTIEKKTVFAFPIKKFSKRIEDKNQRENWIQFICSQFGLSAKSVNSHGDTKDESTEIFYDLFGVKVKA